MALNLDSSAFKDMVLVLGATGTIGRAAVRALVADGHAAAGAPT